MTTSIVQDPQIRSGAPRVDGTRLSVADVVFTVTHGGVDSAAATAYHAVLDLETVVRCLSYCSERQCQASELQSYCEGCTLDPFSRVEADESPEAVWVLATKKLWEMQE